jgi:hypothetical protein
MTLHAVTPTVHWPLLVLAGLTMLAVRPLPSRLLGYAGPAEDLVRRFLELTSRFEANPRLQSFPSAGALEDLHAAFKALDWPDQAAAYHWAVNEAMRHDIRALTNLADADLYRQRRTEAASYWRRVEEEADNLSGRCATDRNGRGSLGGTLSQ